MIRGSIEMKKMTWAQIDTLVVLVDGALSILFS